MKTAIDKMIEDAMTGTHTLTSSAPKWGEGPSLSSVTLRGMAVDLKKSLQEDFACRLQQELNISIITCTTYCPNDNHHIYRFQDNAVCHPDFVRTAESKGIRFRLEKIISNHSAEYRMVPPLPFNEPVAPVRLPPFDFCPNCPN